MSNYFVFTDEAGVYQKNPSNAHIRSNPFYIRANVLMSVDDYRKYQTAMQRINGMYEIPFDEEIKWSDLWRKNKGNPRADFIDRMSFDRLKRYYRKVLETATELVSTMFMFTVTSMVDRTCRLKPETVYAFHLQNAFQRIQMDMATDDFATFIMDELNADTIKQIKKVCHKITVKGDFVQYKNLYQGVLIENSLYSPGIQLADYAAGIMNGYLRKMMLTQNNYQFAADLYKDQIKPHLRFYSANGAVVGYGVIDIPKTPPFREKLSLVFD